MDNVSISVLSGKRVVITRAARQSVELLEKFSGTAAFRSCCRWWRSPRRKIIGPLDRALDQLEEFDWIIFTSENAVRAVVKRAGARGETAECRGKTFAGGGGGADYRGGCGASRLSGDVSG